MDTKWGKGDGMNWEIRIDIYTLYIYIYTLIYIHIYTIYIHTLIYIHIYTIYKIEN